MKTNFKRVMMTAFALVMTVFFCQFKTANAENAQVVTVPVLQTAAELNTISACYTQTGTVTKEVTNTSNLSFTLNEDSWVYFTGNHSQGTNDYGSTHTSIFSDSAMTNKITELGWGYWEYDRECSRFLSKGTYYASVVTKLGNGSFFDGNTNFVIGSIPTTKIFEPAVAVNAGKSTATVTWTNILGDNADYAEYQAGNIDNSLVGDSNVWKWRIAGMFTGGTDAVNVLELSNGAYSFEVAKNGTYTIMLQDKFGSRYSKAIQVTELDGTKPVVKGVKNKKTYKKAVKITFSDKGSGIKSATLNGKKFKSGKKVSKKGSYTLIVTDKVGNRTKVKFKIKK